MGLGNWYVTKSAGLLRRNGLFSKRVINGVSCAFSTYLLGYRPCKTVSYPSFVQVEITNKCNLQCKMCKRAAMFGEGANMRLEDFKTIIDKTPSVLQVHLQGYGEPLINPKLPEMATYARNQNFWVSTSTNGTLLTNKLTDRLLKCEIDEVGISIDGATEKTYSKIRGTSLAELKNKTINFLEKRNNGKYNTKVWLLTVLMKENIFELPQIVDLANEWGFDGIVAQHVTHSAEDLLTNSDRSLTNEFTEEEKQILDIAKDKSKKHGLTTLINDYNFDKKLRCYWPWSGLYVNVNGDVSLCSVMYYPTIGNIFDKNLKGIWNSEEMVEHRKRLQKEGICEGCKFHYYNRNYLI